MCEYVFVKFNLYHQQAIHLEADLSSVMTVPFHIKTNTQHVTKLPVEMYFSSTLPMLAALQLEMYWVSVSPVLINPCIILKRDKCM